MSNFAGYPGVTVSANIVGNTLTIPQQTITYNGENHGFSGSGSINNNILNFSYNENINNSIISITSSGSKR